MNVTMVNPLIYTYRYFVIEISTFNKWDQPLDSPLPISL